jgi:hypothetical protein
LGAAHHLHELLDVVGALSQLVGRGVVVEVADLPWTLLLGDEQWIEDGAPLD